MLLFTGLEYYAFLFTLLSVGGFLVLYFIGRPWPYQLYVPAVVAGTVISQFMGLPRSPAIILLLGPLLGIGVRFWVRMGSVGLLIATVPLVLSARSTSRWAQFGYLILFAVVWVLAGLVSGYFIAFASV
ncbi:MAG: hypothetical protein OXH63_14875 [Gemmatimonadetes bacterium]|nr:hypothetical protein [Gemmatimonadota bacterium]